MDEFIKTMTESAKNGTADAFVAEYMRDAGRRYMLAHSFSIGELIQWKHGMKNCKWPEYGEPIVVIEKILGQRNEAETIENHKFEPMDIRCGVVRDGTFEGLWYDSKRFEPYKG